MKENIKRMKQQTANLENIHIIHISDKECSDG